MDYGEDLAAITALIEEIEGLSAEDIEVKSLLWELHPFWSGIAAESEPSRQVSLQKQWIDSLSNMQRNHPDNKIIQTKLEEAYHELSWYSLLNEQFPQAEEAARAALRKNESNEEVRSNLALSLLLQNNWKEAKAIYESFQGQEKEGDQSWNAFFLAELEALEQAGIEHGNFRKARKLLE